MTRFRLTIEYDGRPFMGWQRQPHGPSVQAAIEDAGKAITGESIILHAAGRTDAGVHAEAMSAHLDVTKTVTAFRLMEGINAKLRPYPIAVLDCAPVADDWHARFSCIGRRYLYRIINRRAPLALDKGRAWRVPQALDSDAMHEAAQVLVGHHDFTTFRSIHCQSASPVKTLDVLDVRRFGEEIEITASARSFLHHQVRSMVGCLMMVGRGQWSSADLKGALDAKDRKALGFNAPPDGLYFVEARYPA
ncbi:MAG: tRNA pseudouridine(38-40) synthase TruA [Sphingomonadaceae bacterium]